MKKNIKNKFSIINNFPLIIMVAAAVLIVLLVNIYLTFKPYDTIYNSGYMVLSNNMAYNLINNNSINDSLTIGVVSVNNGDSIYKQMDSYYVGEEDKKEIDYGYPIYSSDGLTIHAVNDNFTLINRNFEMLDGYPGLSLNYGFVYNEGEDEPADNIDYLFMKFDNSIFINSQVINIQTNENEYSIPVNSPIYFNTKYINYYTFDGNNFNYNRISDIDYDSTIKIGDVDVTYEELLLNMKVAKKIDLELEKEEIGEDNSSELENGNAIGGGNGTGDGTGIGNGNGTGNGTNSNEGIGDTEGESGEDILNSILGEYVEPKVTVESFEAKTYSINFNITIDDPSGAITSNPIFTIYTSTNKLYSRKRITTSGELKMTGLSANSEYKIIGTYTYKDRFGLELTKTIYEKNFKTETVDDLETIKISTETGARYSNKIQIKNLTVLNPGIETLNGVKKIVVQTWEKDKPDEVQNSNVTSTLLKKILKGETTTIETYSNLQSNTVYNYKILFYDKNNNILNLDGPSSGVVKTSKNAPTISKIIPKYNGANNVNNTISITITTNNKDNVYIDEYKYKFYKQNGEVISSGSLDYEDKESKKLVFENLTYEVEYYLQITGTYDLEDGNGEVEINQIIPSENNPFYIVYPSSVTAWYENDGAENSNNNKALDYNENSIKADIYVGKSASVLNKQNGFIKLYLEDDEGNIIKEDLYVNYDSLDEEEQKNVPYYKNLSSFYKIERIKYEGLTSNTNYTIKISVGLLDPNNENSVEFETDKYIVSAPIKTSAQKPYIEVLKKVLYNDNFIFEYKLVDKDNVIGNQTVRLDIYEKDCSQNQCSELYKEKNIYGQHLDLSNKNEKGEIFGSIHSKNYFLDDYTIAISSINKNIASSRKYINVKEKDSENFDTGDLPTYISLSRTINLTAQMKNQTYDEETNVTTSLFEVMYGTTDLQSLSFYDCYSSGKICEKIVNGKDDNEITIDNSISKVTVTIKNQVNDEDEDRLNRQFYVVVENNKNSDDLAIEKIGDSLYYVDYAINKNIYEIASVDDFFGLYANRTQEYEKKYPNGGQNVYGNYVVTADLDFTDKAIETSYYLDCLYGVLDFQGHSVTLTFDENNPFKPFINYMKFSTTTGQSILKNAEFNLNFNFSSAQPSFNGLISKNQGIIQDVIINMYQGSTIPIVYLGFVHSNDASSKIQGVLNRFIIYLHTDLYVDGYSTLGVYSNNGIVKNGYVSTHPDKLNKGEKTVYVGSHFGLVAWQNFNMLKNVYNLVNVKGSNNSKKYAGTLLYQNEAKGIIENTISISETAINGKRGPNMYVNNGSANNNYYVDINKNSNSYDYSSYPYNIPMDEHLLNNTFFINSLLNDEDEKQFEISSWNYPILNLSRFMLFKQKNIPIDYKNDTSVELALAISAEDDVREKITDEEIKQNNLSPADVTNMYQTSTVKLYFNNPNFYPITEIKMEDGVDAKINNENIDIDPTTGMTVVELDLTLTSEGVAKSSYNVEKYCYCVSSDCVYNPRTYCKEPNKSVSVDLFRRITDYATLLGAINKNENILITNDIEVQVPKEYRNGINTKIEEQPNYLGENLYMFLPRNTTNPDKTFIYSGKMYGALSENGTQGITIDFKNESIERGYFFQSFEGHLKNVQIKNFKVSSSSSHIGFIKILQKATVDNVDVSNSEFKFLSSKDVKECYVGTLASYAKNLSSIINTSSNNNTIKIKEDENNNIKTSYAGGLVGYTQNTTIYNSYVYNIKIPELFVEVETDKLVAGGLTAYMDGSRITNAYTTGTIDSNYPNIGGVVGINKSGKIENVYSYMNVFSTGKSIGGIAAVQTNLNTDSYRNVMFIGNIEGSDKFSYLISNDLSANPATIYKGYLLEKDKDKLNNPTISNSTYVTFIGETSENKFLLFDENNEFNALGSEYLPYLKKTSFVGQSITDDIYIDLSEKVDIEISYDESCNNYTMPGVEIGENGLCKNNGDIIGVAKYARVTIPQGYSISSDELTISDCTQDNICEVKPNDVYKDYYVITLNGSIQQKIYLPFYRTVDGANSWEQISTKENENIFINKDIEFNTDYLNNANNIINKKINNLIGASNKIFYGKTVEEKQVDCESDLGYDAQNINSYSECLYGKITNKSEESRLSLPGPLIKSLTGKLENITFENFEVSEGSDFGVGLILFNSGTLTNNNNNKTMFKNIKIDTPNKNKVGIIAINSGYVKNIDIEDIYVSGQEKVGGLIANDITTDSAYHLENINARRVYVSGTYQIGGVHGYSFYRTKNISIEDFYIQYNKHSNSTSTSKGEIGGIFGKGDCYEGCTARNGFMEVDGNYVGGIQGNRSSVWWIGKTEARNLVIKNANASSSSSYVGGIVGYQDGFTETFVENLYLVDSHGNVGNFKGDNIGGAAGRTASSSKKSYIKNSYISGNQNIGGVVGTQIYGGDVNANVVSNVLITANSNYAGGIVGSMSASTGTPKIENNLVYNVTLTGSKIGGIIGLFSNTSITFQNARIKSNIVNNLSGQTYDKYGGIIGELSQVPMSDAKLFMDSIYYVGENDLRSIGLVKKLTTGSGGNGFSSNYSNGVDGFLDDLSDLGFKQIKNLGDVESVFGAKSGSEEMDEGYKYTNANDSSIRYVTDEAGNDYLPLTNITSWKGTVKIPRYTSEEYIIEPDDFEVFPSTEELMGALFSTRKLMTARNFSATNSQDSTTSSSKQVLDLDVYTVDANKINIDFSDIDESCSFYYKIGNYISPSIPVINRTFTIAYDFKESIKITLNCDGGIKTKTIKPTDLIRTISYVDGKVYYIDNGLLYNEDKVITGDFVNLYNNKVLTNGGMIYNISTKEEYSSNVDYNLQYNAQPLYSFEYNGELIETYYNYSIYNSIIKNYQIMLKNGLINVIDDSIDNKKDSYIIDSYNNNETQIVLKNDGVLYSLKGNIKYPNDFDNKNIKDLYTDIYSANNVAVIKYESGEVYAFNYLTGDKLFTSVSNENIGFIDYIKDKLNNNNDNSIVSLVPIDEYTEINLLKGKLSIVSIDEATNKINGDSSSNPIKDLEYISVYNDVTKKYDIYRVDNVLNSIELQSENQKLDRDYELVQFYETLHVDKKQKSLSGIIIFTLSIMSILATLYILIRRKRLRG